MRFLIDRCAGHQLARFLRERGHDVSEVSGQGPDPGDRIILEWAADQGRILVTMDKDFGRLIYLEQQVHAGIVRLPDVRSGERIEIMKQLLADHAADLGTGSVVTIRGGRIRISRSSA